MRKNLTVFVLILIIICLAACGKTTPAQPDANLPDSETATPAADQIPAEAADTQNPSPEDVAEISPQAAKLLARAGKDDLLAVLTDPASSEFMDLDNAAAQSYEIDPGADTVLLVPLKDGLSISIDMVEYDEDSGELIITDTLHIFEGKQGEPIRLTVFLSEGIPSLKLSAAYSGTLTEQSTAMWAEWPFTYDGKEEQSALFLTGRQVGDY